MAPRRTRRATLAQGAAWAALAAGASAAGAAPNSASLRLTRAPGADSSALMTALPRCLGVGGSVVVGQDG